jgi:hypothetical protein
MARHTATRTQRYLVLQLLLLLVASGLDALKLRLHRGVPLTRLPRPLVQVCLSEGRACIRLLELLSHLRARAGT